MHIILHQFIKVKCGIYNRHQASKRKRINFLPPAVYVFHLVLLFFLPHFLSAQIITTIAGTGVQGYNGDGIAATTAQLACPQGLAVDAAGNIYTSDLCGARIRKININTGLINTIAGTGTSGFSGDGLLAINAQISIPSAIAFDQNGDLFFTDRSNNRIRKVNMTTGIITTIAGTAGSGYNGDGIPATTATLNNPNDVAFDSSGNLFIADWINHRVRKVNMTNGIITTVAGTGVAGYNGDGLLATAAQINGPCGILFDNAGNMYIAEFGGSRIRKIVVSTGIISTIAGNGVAGYNGEGIAATAALLNGCAYIRFDAAQNMYIGEGGNQRVRRITRSSGIITTVAGNGTGGYLGDGLAATAAELNEPYNIYFDVLGCNMYIADYNNNRIRKVSGGFSGCPSPVAPGNLVSCQVLPSVTITPANNNSWVPVFDSLGNIAAEIKANGHTLGVVNTSLYTKTGLCRQDTAHRLYLNRNITITPQFPLLGPDSLRIYILKAELDSLRNATNSIGQPSGVASIAQVDVFKNSDACATVGSSSAFRLNDTSGIYNADYYLQVSITSFSSFYFANKALTTILPVAVSAFNGKREGAINILRWNSTCDGIASFSIEHSTDGNSFENIGNVPVSVVNCTGSFVYTGLYPSGNVNYYRIRINETGGATGYSSIISIAGDKSSSLQLALKPNLITGDALNVEVRSKNPGLINLMVSDIEGRILFVGGLNAQAGTNITTLYAPDLVPGVYWMIGTGNDGRSNTVRFVKTK